MCARLCTHCQNSMPPRQGCVRLADTRRRNNRPSPCPPPPRQTQNLQWEKMKFTEAKIALGHVWDTNIWVPDRLTSLTHSSLLMYLVAPRVGGIGGVRNQDRERC